MRWEKVGERNLRLIEIEDWEKEQLNKLLLAMYPYGLKDAEKIVNRLKRDVLKQRSLKNNRLNRTETLAQLSTWCHAVAKHKGVRPYAEEISKLLFAGHVLPRLVDKSSNKPVYNAVQLLDEFIAKVMRDQSVYVYTVQGPTSGEDDIDQTEGGGGGFPPTTVSVERDLRKHIAFDPTVIEQGLKLISEEYSVDGAGRIDVLCEDNEGNLVVIELKKGRSGDAVVGQILRYMGWLKEKQKRSVRGIIILGEPDDSVHYAVAAAPDIEVKYYRVHFDITDEPPRQE